MNKKIIVAIIVVVILAAIIRVVYLVSNDSLNKKSVDDDTSKALGTTIKQEDDKSELKKNEPNEDEQALPNNDVQEQNVSENTENSNKILIAYFSRADENYNVGTVEVGNTEILAKHIKGHFGDRADAFKIDPVKAYPKGYNECTEVAIEEKNSNARPEFKEPNILNMDNYDIIFIGYPIWWGTVPMIINTFLEKYDFSEKIVIPFCTHEGSGESGTFKYIYEKLQTSTVNMEGFSMRGTSAREDSAKDSVETWLKELEY